MRPTLLALLAVLVWSSLAILNTRVQGLSPFLSVGLALCVGGLVGLPKARQWRVPPLTFAVGVGGIFGYHALLFAAFRLAPSVEVNLVNYLWPLLIVLLSPVFLRGFSLRPRHLVGAVLGLAGAALVVSGGGAVDFSLAGLPGYLLAAAAALVWAAYSLLTKRLPPFPTGAVGGFCLASGVLSLGCFLAQTAIEGARLPAIGPSEWVGLVLLGAGPMGLAFYAWDAAMKRGDPRVIGSLSYVTPLLSTLLLVLFGGKRLSLAAGAAMALIVAGAVTGSFDALRAAFTARGKGGDQRGRDRG